MYDYRSKYQLIQVWEDEHGLGRILTLDGAIQLTTYDQHRYHECLGIIPYLFTIKTAHVKLYGQEEIGGGYVTIYIRGEIGAVRAAVVAGAAAAKEAGELVTVHVIAQPHRSVEKLLPDSVRVVRLSAD